MSIGSVQIALVSEQAAPNLLALLDPALTPDEVILLVTSKMQKRADAVQEVLRESGRSIKAKQVKLPDERDLGALQGILLEVASQLGDRSISLNVTGGTKLMALAAYSVAQAAGWSVFYVDIDSDNIVWLDEKRQPQKISQQLRLNHYLRGYGMRLAESIERPLPSRQWQELTDDVVKNIGSFEGAIGNLNYLSQQTGTSLRVKMTDQQHANIHLDTLLRKFEQADVLRVEGPQIIFPNDAARRFASGGWLEFHVYQAVKNVSNDLEIRDLGQNLQVTDIEQQPNEVDVAFLANNRLFTIECKTAKMNDPSDMKANDTLYKIAENRRRIGGIGTKGMLASYRPLRDSEMRLAAALQIEVVKAQELGRMEEKLKQWVKR